jgi:multidrug efflux pump subunit AcrA (membrane-fusion protein)
VDVHLYPVSARISAYIQKVNVGDNQWVDEAPTLVEIDPKEYEAALTRNQATLETSEANAKSSNIDVPQPVRKRFRAVADVRQKWAAVEQAKLNLGYTRILGPVAGEVTKKIVGWIECGTWGTVAHGRPAGSGVEHCEFQGDLAETHARWPQSRDGSRLERPHLSWPFR